MKISRNCLLRPYKRVIFPSITFITCTNYIPILDSMLNWLESVWQYFVISLLKIPSMRALSKDHKYSLNRCKLIKIYKASYNLNSSRNTCLLQVLVVHNNRPQWFNSCHKSNKKWSTINYKIYRFSWEAKGKQVHIAVENLITMQLKWNRELLQCSSNSSKEKNLWSIRPLKSAFQDL